MLNLLKSMPNIESPSKTLTSFQTFEEAGLAEGVSEESEQSNESIPKGPEPE